MRVAWPNESVSLSLAPYRLHPDVSPDSDKSNGSFCSHQALVLLCSLWVLEIQWLGKDWHYNIPQSL